jgi:two-component system, NarL family, response regulator DevR
VESGTKVLVACCNRLLRESIARILAKKTDFESVEMQAMDSTSRAEIVDSRADVLVLDSLEFLLEDPPLFSETGTHIRVIKCVLIAMEDDQDRFVTAIRRGALGYVLQDASAVDVLSAIRTVAEGEAACPPRYTRLLFDLVATQAEELPNSRKHAQWGLTCREQQLIPLIGRGLRNKEIANHLGLSEQTVKNHVHRILRKMGVSDRLSVSEACQIRAFGSSTKSTGYAD